MAVENEQSWKDNLTSEQLRFLSHLYYEPYQTVEQLAEHTGFSCEAVERLVQELPQVVSVQQGGKLVALAHDRSWARELALQASRERNSPSS
jgi:hypothetical protein